MIISQFKRGQDRAYIHFDARTCKFTVDMGDSTQLEFDTLAAAKAFCTQWSMGIGEDSTVVDFAATVRPAK